MLRARLQTLVQHASGMHLSPATVERAARDRLRSRDDMTLAQYLVLLEAEPAEMTALLELLVVPETWFFRDPAAFAAASNFVTTRHALLERAVRILSVPCATGEEAYSLAMAMRDAGVAPAKFSIEAIDLSANALAKARRGLYGANAFRSDDLAFRGRYFSPTAEGESLHAEIRALVGFSQGNLLGMGASSPTRQYDLIFCRNLLIYFDQPTQLKAISVLDGLLADGGLLFSGYAEMPIFTEYGFETARIHKAFALRRAASGMQAAPAAAGPRPRSGGVGPSPAPLATEKKPRRPAPHFSPAARLPALTPGLAASPAAAARDPDRDATAALTTARRLADSGDYGQARLELAACLQAHPDCAAAYALLGALHLHLDDLAAACTALQRALYLDPGHYDVICQLALVYDRQQNVSGARALRARATRLADRRTAGRHGTDPAQPREGSA